MTLDDQDRTRWDADQIADGLHILAAADHLSDTGPYQLPGAFAAGHATARCASDTDRSKIAAL